MKIENSTDKILGTERLVIQKWKISDAERLFEICRQPKVMKHIGTGKAYKTIEEAEKFLNWAEEFQANNNFCRWAVVEKSSGEIVGSCGFVRLKETEEIEFGYLFDEKFWNRGFATEAARECLKYGFGNLGFREIIALTGSEHFASHNVLEKIGFLKRGIEIYDGEETLVFSAKNN